LFQCGRVQRGSFGGLRFASKICDSLNSCAAHKN
jgi:hypothetical protein